MPRLGLKLTFMAIPKHIAISLDDISDWCRKNNISVDSTCEKFFRNLSKLLKLQVKLNFPMMTIYLLSDNPQRSPEEYILISDFISDFFNKLFENSLVSEQQIKISIFGKWYKLPGKSVESLKNIIEATKDYRNFFANFCINYDGQEEIVDACRLIAKQVELGKIDSNMITKENIRENLYSSYFLPPDIIIIYGEKKLRSFLMWDSVDSKIIFADKSWMEFEEEDIESLI